MAYEIERLQSLYRQLDSFAGSGDDVVADLRKEIKNLELTYMRNVVFPKIANILGDDLKHIRCDVDCNFQYLNDKISYSFCTSDSPLIKDSVAIADCRVSKQTAKSYYSDAEIMHLQSSLENIAELAASLSKSAETALSEFTKKNEVKATEKPASQKTIPAAEFIEQPVQHGEMLLYVKGKGCNAIGKLLPSKKVVVLKGSIIRADATNSYASKEMREDLISRFCHLTEQGYVVDRDLPAMSISGASGLCMARSSNGYVDWKDENGTRLAEILR